MIRHNVALGDPNQEAMMHTPNPTARRSRRAIRLAIGVAAALTTTALSGCVGGAAPATGDGIPLGEEATLTIVSQFGDNAALQPVLDEISAQWEAKHPEVTVEIQYLTVEDEQNTVPTALASGSGPDVFDYDAAEGALGVLATSGLVHPMDGYAEQYGWYDRLPEAVVERTTYDGEFYAVPRSSEAIGLFYNGDILAEHGISAPTSYDTFIAAADALKAAGVIPVAFGNKDQWPSSHLIGAAIHSSVPVETIASIESVDGVENWSTDDVQAAFDEARRWAVDGYLTPDFNGVSFDDAFNSFMTGQAGMFIEGTGATPDVLANMADSDVHFVSFPMRDAGLAQQAEGGVGGSWAISSSSKAPDIAADWINYVHFSDEAERAWIEAGVLPTTDFDSDGLDIPALLQENVQVVQEALDGGGIGRWTGYTSSPLVTDAWNGGGQAFLAGEIDAVEFTKSLDDALAEARSGSQ